MFELFLEGHRCCGTIFRCTMNICRSHGFNKGQNGPYLGRWSLLARENWKHFLTKHHQICALVPELFHEFIEHMNLLRIYVSKSGSHDLVSNDCWKPRMAVNNLTVT